MAKCKSCGADIIWIKMQSGKSMPCDAGQITYWKKKNGTKVIVTPNGEVIHEWQKCVVKVMVEKLKGE